MADGGSVVAVRCDIARPDNCNAAVEAAVGVLGRLDVLVNYPSGAWTPLVEIDATFESWHY